MKTQLNQVNNSTAYEPDSKKQASPGMIIQAYGRGSQLRSIDLEEPIQRQENKTGLPDNLKSGVENLSGYSLNDVKVHYGSSKPAELKAHAYAQGTDIHIAPGQEKHLPHEAWHVVQQKQGRVQPTRQLKGTTNINDDQGLEKEADVMGAKAIQLKSDNLTAGIPIQEKRSEAPKKKNSSISQSIIQKRDPEAQTLAKNQILTHGSAVGDFLKNRKKEEDGTKDIPDGPAWLAEDDEAFSVHATVAMQGYKKLNDGESKPLTVHIYNTNDDINLASWENWKQVPEYIYRQTGLDIKTKAEDYDKVNGFDMNDDEKKAMLHAFNSDKKLNTNTQDAANKLEPLINKDGYRIQKDLVLRKPEDILFEDGLKKLDRTEKRIFDVTMTKELLTITGDSNTYTYDPKSLKSFKKI